MPTFHRALWRAASRLVTVLETERREALTIALPQGSWTLLEVSAHQLSYAIRQRWSGAAQSMRKSLQAQLRWLITDLRTLVAHLDGPADPRPLEVRDVYDELCALSAHYADVAVNLQETTISVTIDRVTWDEIDLGRFQLVWNWSRRGEGGELTVIALEPKCCTARADVTHPHLLEETLCVGEAASALRLAVDTGRLFDYFEIVERVLRTYNPGGAYIALSEWYGTACTGCDETSDPEDLSRCEQCAEPFCACCQTKCSACGRVICHGCAVNCTECEKPLCRLCRPTRSSRPTCPPCLEQKRKDPHVDHTPSAAMAAPPNDPAVHADRVGQTPLPPGCR
jgi:hypothetical protein